MLKKLKSLARSLKRELNVYQIALKDPDTPKLAKVLLAVAIGYTLSPIDIIPDFIPVIGHLDDVIIVPAMIWWALKLIPEEVMDECRMRVHASKKKMKEK